MMANTLEKWSLRERAWELTNTEMMRNEKIQLELIDFSYFYTDGSSKNAREYTPPNVQAFITEIIEGR